MGQDQDIWTPARRTEGQCRIDGYHYPLPCNPCSDVSFLFQRATPFPFCVNCHTRYHTSPSHGSAFYPSKMCMERYLIVTLSLHLPATIL